MDYIDEEKRENLRHAIYEGALKLIASDIMAPGSKRYYDNTPDPDDNSVFLVNASLAAMDAKEIYEASMLEADQLFSLGENTIEAEEEEAPDGIEYENDPDQGCARVGSLGS